MPHFQVFHAKGGRHAAYVAIRWPLLTVLVLLFWQFLTVRYNYAGNWTALFCTGQEQPVPPDLQPGTYRFPNSNGYDGQMYRYVAHDPLFKRGYVQYADDAARRWQRILIPGLAFAASCGNQRWVDASYIAVIAFFVFLGSYWLSAWASLHAFHPAWGMVFLLVPSTLISMDRMVVDVASAALTVGFVLFYKISRPCKLYVVLVLAGLARETGALLALSVCLVDLSQKRLARAIVWGTAILPALGWFLFLRCQPLFIGASGKKLAWVVPRPGLGLIGRLLSPRHYGFSPGLELVIRSLDVLSLAAMVCAIAAGVFILRMRPLDPLPVAAFLYAVLAGMLATQNYWGNCYGYGRLFSPLLILIALIHAGVKGKTGWRWALLPVAIIDLRIAAQLTPQAGGILRGLLGG